MAPEPLCLRSLASAITGSDTPGYLTDLHPPPKHPTQTQAATGRGFTMFDTLKLKILADVATGTDLTRSLKHFVQWVGPQLAGPSAKRPVPFKSHGGFGLQAPADGKGYQAGETVFIIPKRLWGPVSAEAAITSAKGAAPAFYSALRRLEAADASSGSSGSEGQISNRWGAMALATYLCSTHIGGEGPEHPYLRFICETSPETRLLSVEHPLMLLDESACALFQASPVVAELRKRRERYASVHQQLFSQPEAAAAVPFDLFLWAVVRVLTRAISDKGVPLTMVPFLDLINHRFNPNCEYNMLDGSGAGRGRAREWERGNIVVRAITDIK